MGVKLNKMLSTTALFSLMVFSTYAQAATELSKQLAGMDLDCGVTQSATHNVLQWMVPDARGKLAAPVPAELKKIAGAPKVTNMGDYWQVDVPLKNATYKGFPVLRIERWAGKNNGISGFALVFSSKVDEIAKTIKTPKFTENPDSDITTPVWETTTRKPGSAMLSCDFST